MFFLHSPSRVPSGRPESFTLWRSFFFSVAPATAYFIFWREEGGMMANTDTIRLNSLEISGLEKSARPLSNTGGKSASAEKVTQKTLTGRIDV
jgi:hypothetical protein